MEDPEYKMSEHEPKNINNETPFKENLEKNKVGLGSFETLPSLKGKIIRRNGLWMSGVPKRSMLDWLPYDDLALARDELNLLRDQYGISIPDFDFVIGKGEEGRTDLLTVVDEVVGQNLYGAEEIPSEAAPKFNHFFEGLTQYFIDAYKNKRRHLSDIVIPEQYIYGHESGDGEDKIYLVDIEPKLMKEWTSEWVGILIDELKRRILPWISDLENKFFKPGDLDEAKQKVNEAVTYLEKER